MITSIVPGFEEEDFHMKGLKEPKYYIQKLVVEE